MAKQEFDRDLELSKLEDAYSDYMVRSASVRAEVKEEFRKRQEAEVERRTQALKAEFGRKMAESPLKVADRQKAIRTRAWGKYSEFLAAAGVTSTSTTPKPRNLNEYESLGVTRTYDEGVPYAYEVNMNPDENPLVTPVVELMHSGDNTLYVVGLDGGLDGYDDVKVKWYLEHVLASIPNEDKEQYRLDFGLEEDE